MAFLVQENSFAFGSDNEFNSAFLMSFLEEPACQEYNHEELDRLMRSLEAEINPNATDINDLMMDAESSSDESHIGYESESVDLEFQWGDMEAMPSPSPSQDMNWEMDAQGEGIDALVEIGDNFSDLYFDDVVEGKMYTTSWIDELDQMQ
ncbi:hypothetical protein CCACVL1_16574 [Corchorus capsularis]|uniref:Uncharacterized protein n=1 Tax=Corchorus capsularis TaxID=210143 RepID=A0A1R3HW75_COCAP|nr:hypothetical protein CCACVL1_16574 [Corchorus capsularis]